MGAKELRTEKMVKDAEEQFAYEEVCTQNYFNKERPKLRVDYLSFTLFFQKGKFILTIPASFMHFLKKWLLKYYFFYKNPMTNCTSQYKKVPYEVVIRDFANGIKKNTDGIKNTS